MPTNDCAPPTSCPDPSGVYPGTTCSVAIGQACYSTDIPSYTCGGGSMPPPTSGTCTCTPNGWSCPQAAVPACVAPSCPDPYTLYPNTGCMPEAMTCPGNPTLCGNEVYYDALLCKGGSWYDIAPTSCDLFDYDGGFEDTYPYDAPYYVLDGGFPQEND